jgi:hypothetical protein
MTGWFLQQYWMRLTPMHEHLIGQSEPFVCWKPFRNSIHMICKLNRFLPNLKLFKPEVHGPFLSGT